MNSEQYVIANLSTETLKDRIVYVQFVCLHSNQYQQRLLRVINLGLEVINSEDNNKFYAKLDCDAIVLSVMRRNADLLKETPRKDLRANVVNDLKEILLAFKEENKEYKPNEISVPRKIDNILIYTHALMKDSLLNTKINLKNDTVFANLLFYQQNSVLNI